MSAADDFLDGETPAQPTLPPTLEEIAEEKVKRDRWGRPLIVQPDGSLLPYNRASSYGDQIEDKRNVNLWALRQVVRGIKMKPEMLGAVPDGEYLENPWTDPDRFAKKALTRISEQAQEVAGSNLKSALGTQIHAATEYIDRGDDLESNLADLDPVRRAWVIERANAYHKVVCEFGFKYTAIEEFGVQDELQVAGTYDRRGFVPWWPEHKNTILDVKTSSSLDFAGIGFAVQFATYAHMMAYDLDTAERTPHDDMNLKKALIIHVGREKGSHVTIAEVDIEFGWRHARLAREILVARREAKKGIREISESEAAIYACSSRAELKELLGDGSGWAQSLRNLANERYRVLA